MKRSIPCLCLVLGIGLAAPVLHAQQDNQDTTAQTAKKDKKKAEKPKLGKANKAIGRLRTLNKVKPNGKAAYYIILQSASWCSGCNAEMPRVVAAYEEMKKEGLVELVLASADYDPASAKGFVDKHNGKFPVVMAKDAKKIPHFKPAKGIPWAMVLDADGNEVENNNGAIIVPKWKQYEEKAMQARNAAAADATE